MLNMWWAFETEWIYLSLLIFFSPFFLIYFSLFLTISFPHKLFSSLSFIRASASAMFPKIPENLNCLLSRHKCEREFEVSSIWEWFRIDDRCAEQNRLTLVYFSYLLASLNTYLTIILINLFCEPFLEKAQLSIENWQRPGIQIGK